MIYHLSLMNPSWEENGKWSIKTNYNNFNHNENSNTRHAEKIQSEIAHIRKVLPPNPIMIDKW